MSDKSVSKQLEELTSEYDATLILYNKAKADITNKDKRILKDKKIIGGQALSEVSAKSAEDCSAICTSDEQCSAAFYKGNKCTTYSGDGVEAVASETAGVYAIMNDNVRTAKRLNRKLNELNAKIKELSKLEKPNIQVTSDQLNEAEKVLQSEEDSLNKALQQQDDTVSSIKETTIQTTMNQYWYWFLIVGVFLLVCVLIYIFYFSKPVPGVNTPNRNVSNGWFNNRPSTSSYPSRPSTSSYSSYPSRPSNSYPSRPSTSYSSRPSNSSYYRPSNYSRPSYNNNRNYNPFGGGGLFKEGSIKYQALIPAAVMLCATLVATQLQRFIF